MTYSWQCLSVSVSTSMDMDLDTDMAERNLLGVSVSSNSAPRGGQVYMLTDLFLLLRVSNLYIIARLLDMSTVSTQDLRCSAAGSPTERTGVMKRFGVEPVKKVDSAKCPHRSLAGRRGIAIGATVAVVARDRNCRLDGFKDSALAGLGRLALCGTTSAHDLSSRTQVNPALHQSGLHHQTA
jgi:hypothetical protein